MTKTAHDVDKGINLHIKEPKIHSFERAYHGVTGIYKHIYTFKLRLYFKLEIKTLRI